MIWKIWDIANDDETLFFRRVRFWNELYFHGVEWSSSVDWK
jgi:hypothetical protein